MAYLVCSEKGCDGETFVSALKLKQTNSGSVVPEVNGYLCATCMGKADIGKMLKQLDLKKKTKELRDLTEEVNAEVLPAPPSSGPTVV